MVPICSLSRPSHLCCAVHVPNGPVLLCGRTQWHPSNGRHALQLIPGRSSAYPCHVSILQFRKTRCCSSVAPAGTLQEHSRIPRKGDVLQLTCQRYGEKGVGVCPTPEGFIVLVERALPGEELEAVILSVEKGRYAKAAKKRTIKMHADAVAPKCPHFGPCGGCVLQNLDYKAQLAAKQLQVQNMLNKNARASTGNYKLHPIAGCEQIYNYRNKMEFSFGMQRWVIEGSSARTEQGFVLGLHRPGSHIDVMPVTTCALQDDIANGILQLVESTARSLDLPPYDPTTNKGFLRHLVIRKGSNPETKKPEFMVLLVTAPGPTTKSRKIAAAVQEQFPAVVSVYLCVSKATPRMDKQILLAGQERISETLGGLRFSISPQSFFQTNTAQAEVLYKLVAQAAELKPSDVLFDMYCGTGTIGLTLASGCAAVHGFEIIDSAVEDAKANAESNGISNATFHLGNLDTATAVKALASGLQPDVVIMDPARNGLERGVAEYLNGCGARRLVYVSCSPPTQARDINRLCSEAGAAYRLVSVQPVDMFPHTDHVESIAVLDRV